MGSKLCLRLANTANTVSGSAVVNCWKLLDFVKMSFLSLKQVTIFTRGGLILVNDCLSEEPICVSELAGLVHKLKQDKSSFGPMSVSCYDELTGLAFVCLFEVAVEDTVAHDFLNELKGDFVKCYRPDNSHYDDFSAHIRKLVLLRGDFAKVHTGSRVVSPHAHRFVSNEFDSSAKASPDSDVCSALEDSSRNSSPHTCLDQPSSSSKPDFESKLEKRAEWCRSFFGFRQSHIREENMIAITALLKEKLTKRNVTNEISDLLVREVTQKLVSTRMTNSESLSTAIHRALEEAVVRVLNCAKTVDVLHRISTHGKRPYVITFIGVNGVGKSTSLSKLVNWLMEQKLSVMVAACDTFRAGAVEQLRTHCRRLNCALYERGYERDPSIVAQQAIQQAARQNIDVVMIDTAGRMQDNEPLMRALAKLLNLNKPDLTLFVGEALVGNDGVSQILQFERRLRALTEANEKTVIDGIFLTKFDTIDDKVGAALSLVYASCIPVLFVGTGQLYGDIRKFQAKYVAESLLMS